MKETKEMNNKNEFYYLIFLLTIVVLLSFWIISNIYSIINNLEKEDLVMFEGHLVDKPKIIKMGG